MSDSFQIKDFDSKKDGLDRVWWAIVGAISDQQDAQMTSIIDDIHKKGFADVKLVINGIEVPFKKTLDRLFEYQEKDINDAAIELLKNKFGNITDILYEIEKSIKEKFSTYHDDGEW